jgi:hypothetical protein
MGNSTLRELTIIELIALLTTIFTMLGILIGIFRVVIPLARRLSNLTDDWHGERARPGVPERKGVMQRLSDQDEILEELKHRLQGHADGDEPIPAQLAAVDRRVLGNSHRIRAIEHLLRRHIRESEAWVTRVSLKAQAETDFEVPPWPELREDEEDGAG